LIALSALGTLFTDTSAGAGDTLTFGPVADTSVRSDRPTRNLGSAISFAVDGDPVKHALLRFSVSGIGTSTVASAKLRLYNVDKSPVGGNVYRVVDDSWGETTVTWNTAPVADPTLLASLGAVAPNTWYEVDLTSLVTADGTYSLQIASTSSNGAAYTSKEGAVGFRPQLVLVLAAPDTTPPVVSITSPGSGDTVSGTVTVRATASDAVGVTDVELLVDGVLRGTDPTPPYEFAVDTLALPNGQHDLVAQAHDAAGNIGTSATLTVTVSNTPDTGPPTAPTGLTAATPSSTRVDLTWIASTDDVAVDHYAIFRDGLQVGTSTSPSYSDATVGPGATYGYSVTAYDPAGYASPPSETVSVTTPEAPTSVVFVASGDHGANARTDASLAALDASGVSFYLALGDMDYEQTVSDEAWCDYVKAGLPSLGPAFPFQLVAGNHEEQGGSGGYIINHAACLPDRLNSTLSPTSQYAAEYYFDSPPGAPLVRVIMIAPDLLIENVAYDYRVGTPHYSWLSGAIDDARASGIPWVVVGMHKVCITAGRKGCEIGADLMNLLIEKKVDLVLQGHDHNYQRSKQLSLTPSTCPAVPIGAYDPDCVVDDGVDGVYPKGAGTLFVIGGTFGMGLYELNPSDPEAPYFAGSDATTSGFTKYTVTADRIEARFVNSLGAFTDAFTILAGEPPRADITLPTTPTDLTATARSSTQVDLSWTASIDDVAVDRYAISRDGVRIGTSTGTSYSDTTASSGTTHAYSVTAYDPAGNPSPPSEIVSVTTPGPPTLTFGPDADARIRADRPSSNFGSAITLSVDASPTQQILLRFTVSGIGSGTVASAKLRLYNVDASTAGGTFYQVPDDSWGETTVTWDTAPPADQIAIASLGAVTPNTWYEVDLTPIVTGDGTYSFRITSTSSNGADYTSKEGTAGLGPQLVIALQP
jgi:hypothetical protein